MLEIFRIGVFNASLCCKNGQNNVKYGKKNNGIWNAIESVIKTGRSRGPLVNGDFSRRTTSRTS